MRRRWKRRREEVVGSSGTAQTVLYCTVLYCTVHATWRLYMRRVLHVYSVVGPTTRGPAARVQCLPPLPSLRSVAAQARRVVL